MNSPYERIWAYSAFREIRAHGSYTTPDGVLITPQGSANDPMSQGYVFQQGDKKSFHKGFWGSETLFLSMPKFVGAG